MRGGGLDEVVLNPRQSPRSGTKMADGQKSAMKVEVEMEESQVDLIEIFYT